MPRAFLCHKSQEKTMVEKAARYLKRCLIDTWIDEQQIVGGHHIFTRLSASIHDNDAFLYFVSHRSLRSSWCQEEVQLALDLRRDKKVSVIPILLDEQEKLDIKSLPADLQHLIRPLLENHRRIFIDPHDPDPGFEEIAKAIWHGHGIRFYPVNLLSIEKEDLQLISWTLEGDLDPALLGKLDLGLEARFLATDGNQDRPQRKSKPVALYGKGPNWIYTHLSTPFKNLCPVYVYSQPSKGFICVYDDAKPPQSSRLGRVLLWESLRKD